MARAKRTSDRADARRRYRQTQVSVEDQDVEATPVPAAATAATPGRPVRVSITAAFREAFHRANIREDLPYLPSLLRHWSFWVPLGLMIGSAILAVVAPAQPVVVFAAQSFVYPPALIVLFICGFFAKRASYLLGSILGVANVLVYGGLVVYGVRTGQSLLSDSELVLLIGNVAALSIPSGALFASLAAWYRRFLNLTSPNRNRRPAPKGRPKPARQGTR